MRVGQHVPWQGCALCVGMMCDYAAIHIIPRHFAIYVRPGTTHKVPPPLFVYVFIHMAHEVYDTAIIITTA